MTREINSINFLDYQALDAKIKLNKLSIKSLYPFIELLGGTVKKEIIPVVTQNYEYEYRDISILIAFFGIFGLPGF